MRAHILEQLGTIETSIGAMVRDMEETGKNAVLANGLFLQQRLEQKTPPAEAPAGEQTSEAPASAGVIPDSWRSKRSRGLTPRI
jgi:hypothetical protein